MKPGKYETYNYTQSNWPTAGVNECSKVKVYGLIEPLNFICLGIDFLVHLDHQLLQTSNI